MLGGTVLFNAAAGLFVGRLRVPDQLDPPPRAGADAHRTLLPPHLRGLLHGVLPGHHSLHADLLCGLPGELQWVRFLASAFPKQLPLDLLMLDFGEGSKSYSQV